MGVCVFEYVVRHDIIHINFILYIICIMYILHMHVYKLYLSTEWHCGSLMKHNRIKVKLHQTSLIYQWVTIGYVNDMLFL